MRKQLPRVTKILDWIAKPGLYRWYAKHGWSEAQQIMYTAAKRGTSIHKEVARGVKYSWRKPLLSSENRLAVSTFRGWEERNVKCWHWFEESVFNYRAGYRGHADCGFTLLDNRNVIGDFKTTRGTYLEHVLQGSAYYFSETVQEDGGYDTLALINMKLDSLDIPYWTISEIRRKEKAFEAFLGVKKLFDAQESHRKGLFLKPLVFAEKVAA